MSETAMAPCRPDSPLMKAWEAYQAGEDYKNSFIWAMREHAYQNGPNGDRRPAGEEQRAQWVQGSLWAAFMHGFLVATERAASLHEQINPASDDERQSKTPGAGAMGAVIEYRDSIRQQSRNT